MVPEPENIDYLKAKKDKLGHMLDLFTGSKDTK
jgi:hypothetical protein